LGTLDLNFKETGKEEIKEVSSTL